MLVCHFDPQILLRQTRFYFGGAGDAGGAERSASLVMTALPTVLFGIVTRWPSSVRTRVLRKPTDSTTPSTWSSLIRSPIRNGLSVRTATAPNKLESVSCAARLRASPPMETEAIRLVTFRP